MFTIFNYVGGISSPQQFKIIYDEAEKRLKSEPSICDDRVAVTSIDRKLKLFFRLQDGYWCGFEYGAQDIDSILPGKIKTPAYCDGSVRLDGFKGVAGQDCFYVDINVGELLYDREQGIIALGHSTEDGCSFRVCENLIISIDCNCRLCGFYIKLKNFT